MADLCIKSQNIMLLSCIANKKVSMKMVNKTFKFHKEKDAKKSEIC